MKQYDNLAKLRLSLNRAGQTIYVKSHTTEGDGGGGEFWLDTSDTTTADDNGINIVDSVIPRIGTWKRLLSSGGVNVNQFGATSLLDSTEIQAFFDYATANDSKLSSELFDRNESTYTVGANANFSTLNEALRVISDLKPVFKSLEGDDTPLEVVIELQSGFILAEQVFVYGQDMGWIKISSVDAEVTIDRSAINTVPVVDNWVGSYTPVFTAMRNATLPVIDTLFSMDTSGAPTGNRLGIFLHEACSGVVTRTNGIKNCDGRGIEISGSMFYGRETDFSGSLDAAYRVSNASIANIRQSNGSGSVRGLYCTAAFAVANDCDFSNCSEYPIYASGESTVHAPDTAAGTCDLSGAGVHGVFADDNSRVNVTDANITGAGTNAIEARSGAVVTAPGADVGTPGNRSISAQTGAKVIANAAINVGDVVIFNGAEVVANGISGATFSQIANLISEAGIIYADSTDGDTVTIVSGAIIITAANRQTVDTEGAAASDDLSTVTGGNEGQTIKLSQVSNTRDVTYKDGTGNLILASGDFVGTTTSSSLVLKKFGSDWYELARYS